MKHSSQEVHCKQNIASDERISSIAKRPEKGLILLRHQSVKIQGFRSRSCSYCDVLDNGLTTLASSWNAFDMTQFFIAETRTTRSECEN